MLLMASVQGFDDVRASPRARPYCVAGRAPRVKEAMCAARGAYYGLAFGICVWAVVLLLGWLVLRLD